MTLQSTASENPPKSWKNNAISASELFDRKSSVKWSLLIVFTLLGVLASVVTWAAFMPITEISESSGEIVPGGAVQEVQHLEGGIVSAIHVREGQYVTKDEVLLDLSPHIAQSELDQLQTRLAGLQFRIRFLTAARNEGVQEAEGFDEEYGDIARAIKYELATRKEAVSSQVEVLNQQIREREAELNTLRSRAEGVAIQIRLKTEQVIGRRTLVEKGLFPKMDLVEDERELASLTDQQVSLTLEASRVGELIGEIQQRIIETRARYHSEIAGELSGLASEAAEVRVAIERAKDRVSRLLVKSPLSGRVNDLKIKTVGGVVDPGETMMEIVPDGTKLKVEVRVSTQDIGYVHIGQKANIKVLTYDYSRFGTISGHVEQISATTFSNDDGVPFYRADIVLDADTVGDSEDRKVAPGMTVIADIQTGEKTLLQAITSPVLRSFDSAFRER